MSENVYKVLASYEAHCHDYDAGKEVVQKLWTKGLSLLL